MSDGFADLEDGRLWYERAGGGLPVVFVHSGLMHAREWQPQFEAFAEQHEVVRYDRRGFGRSDASSGPFSDLRDLRACSTRSRSRDARSSAASRARGWRSTSRSSRPTRSRPSSRPRLGSAATLARTPAPRRSPSRSPARSLRVIRIADLVAGQVPGASKRVVAETDQLVNVGKPERFNRLALDFLAFAG